MSDNTPSLPPDSPTDIAAPAPRHLFTPAEEAQLIAADIHAAWLVSGLMSLIFVMGLVLYIVVLITTL